MRILVFSNNSWDDTNSLGNTLSNFFDGDTWKNDIFYNIYMRNNKPKNNVCNKYFQIKPNELLVHFFEKEKIGHIVSYTESIDKVFDDNKYIDLIHKKKINIVYPFMEYIYRKCKWINNNFKEFITDANPDIFFSFLTNVAMLKPMIRYIKESTNAKVVLFIADDVFGSINKMSILRRNKLKKEFIEVINSADKIYAISHELIEQYSKLFNKEINLLYKGCSFNYPVKRELNNPLKFVYAGNLLYGRDNILQKIGIAIKKNNSINNQKAILEIYTGSIVNDELKRKLNIDNCSTIVGKKNYNEIKEIMNNADFNLQVESFDKEQIDIVKYSFSTKIIDCLQSGSSAVAIGPGNISSIKYMKTIPGVLVIDNYEDIENEINQLIINKDEILSNAKKMRKYALHNHSITDNQKRIKNDFILLKKE